MSEPLGELEFYLKRAEATVKRNPDRYAIITMMVNKTTKETKDTIHGDGGDITVMVTYLMSKVILKLWDVLPSDQERIELLAKVTQGLTDTVTDAWKKAQEANTDESN